MKFSYGPIRVDVVELNSPHDEINFAAILSDGHGSIYYAVEEAYKHTRGFERSLPMEALLQSVAEEAMSELFWILDDLEGVRKTMIGDGIPKWRADFAKTQASTFIKQEVADAAKIADIEGA